MNLIRFPLLTFPALTLLAALALGPGCANSGNSPASKKVVTLTKDNWEAEVMKSSQPVLVDFWAPWCAPCKAIAPAVGELADEFDGRARVGKVNIDDQPELTKQFGIESIPTFLFFKNGKLIEQTQEVPDKAELKSKLEALVAGKK